MMKKLPLKVDSYVMSECWTFYKLAIIQTHPDYHEWLAGHMSVVMLDDYNTLFGDQYGTFPTEYFNDILCYEEIDVSSFDPDSVIDVFKKEIDNGGYIIFDCNFNGFYGPFEEGSHDIHETLLYGYNDEDKTMFTTEIIQGKFCEAQMPYSDIIKGYKQTLEYFSEKPKEIYYRRNWFYPVTRITLKDKLYCVDPVYKLIRKLNSEYEGGKCTRTYMNDSGAKETHEYYHGMGIVEQILDICKTALKEDIGLYNKQSGRISGAYIKLHEHGIMIMDSVKWAYDKMNINSKESKELYDRYAETVDLLQMLYLLCFKYRFNNKASLLESIAQKTEQCLVESRQALKALEEFLLDEYVKYNSAKIVL